jgi:ribonuclease J
MLETVRPRYLLPVHGELRHQHLHARLAQETGLSAQDTFILQNGSCWVTDGDKAWLESAVPAADVYVDGFLVGEIGEQVMLDRGRLAQDGFVVVNVPVDKYRQLAGEPRLLTRGFFHGEESDELMAAATVEIKRGLRRNGRSKKQDYLDNVEKTLQDFFYSKTQSRPVILPNFVKA